MSEQIVIYTLNNPRKKLPLDELTIAVYEGMTFEITGILEDGSICTYTSRNLDE